MKKLLPFAVILIVGFGAGFGLAAALDRDVTIVSTGADGIPVISDEMHELTAMVRIAVIPSNFEEACPSEEVGLSQFAIRAPSDGIHEGDLLAVPDTIEPIDCGEVLVTFLHVPDASFYVVEYEDRTSLAGSVGWGPFSRYQLERAGWSLQLAR